MFPFAYVKSFGYFKAESHQLPTALATPSSALAPLQGPEAEAAPAPGADGRATALWQWPGEISAFLCGTEDRSVPRHLRKDGLRRVFSKLLVG